MRYRILNAVMFFIYCFCALEGHIDNLFLILLYAFMPLVLGGLVVLMYHLLYGLLKDIYEEIFCEPKKVKKSKNKK